MEPFIDYFHRVAAYDPLRVCIELFLIGLVVYWIVEFLEGTRGERLFRGVIFLLLTGVLILRLVVEKFGLERLDYLYKGFLIGVLIIAVAAFQPEVRRALMRIGQPKFLAGASQQLAVTIEQIISAIMNLSENKIGAIIVVEKKVALGEFIETGVRIDAKVTAELLKTIFYPGSALHDMAVIIRGDQIIAASVQLPLAEPGTVDGVELGSRHRAAIGITTGSDAIVIVASEETGIISIAQNSQLIRNITEDQLRKSLTTAIDQMTPTIDRLLKFSFKKNKQINEKIV